MHGFSVCSELDFAAWLELVLRPDAPEKVRQDDVLFVNTRWRYAFSRWINAAPFPAERHLKQQEGHSNEFEVFIRPRNFRNDQTLRMCRQHRGAGSHSSTSGVQWSPRLGCFCSENLLRGMRPLRGIRPNLIRA